jgi:hypothetical protein
LDGAARGYIERDAVNAITERELVVLREFLDRRCEPFQELIVRLHRRSGLLCIVGFESPDIGPPSKKLPRGLRPPDPEGFNRDG